MGTLGERMGLLIILGLGTVGVFLLRQHQASRLQSWENAAEELGLSVSAGSMFGGGRMVGVVAGFPVEVEFDSDASTKGRLAATVALGVLFRSGSNSVRTWTRYRVGYADLDLGLRLSRQTVFTSIGRLFGGRDAEIGDEAFDSAFRVETDLPSKAKPFFTPTRRDSLRRLLASYPDVEVSDTEMLMERDGWERDALTIVSVVRRMVAAAKTLSGDAADTEPIDDAIGLRLAGDAAEAAETLTGISADHPNDLDLQILEVDALVAAGAHDRAAMVIKDLEVALPKDPEVTGWKRRIGGEAVSVSEAGEIDTDPVAQAQRLFGEARLSFETDAIFEAEFRGRRIQWSGTVRRISRRQSDADFAGPPLTKAVIGVASISNDLYGNVEVDAVVSLPPETADELQRGDQVTFTGQLDKVDSITRNIYIANGNLT